MKLYQPDFRTIDVGKVRLRVAVQGSGPLVLMVHGFPESWYSWRQMPDLRGADVLPGCGHWTQQERPAEVNARLVGWLKGL